MKNAAEIFNVSDKEGDEIDDLRKSFEDIG